MIPAILFILLINGVSCTDVVPNDSQKLSPHCSSNAPKLDPASGVGHVKKLAGIKAYVSGAVECKRAVILASDIFGYEAPNLRKIADKVAAAGFYAVVPDFFHGDAFVAETPERPKSAWMNDHPPEKGFEDAKLMLDALKREGVSSIGAAGFCWGAKVAVELAKASAVQAATMFHPSFVTVDDIKSLKVPIAILGAERDGKYPPALLKQFDEILSANKVDRFVKVFPNCKHGFAIRYNTTDPTALSLANEAHQDMLVWFGKYVK